MAMAGTTILHVGRTLTLFVSKIGTTQNNEKEDSKQKSFESFLFGIRDLRKWGYPKSN